MGEVLPPTTIKLSRLQGRTKLAFGGTQSP